MISIKHRGLVALAGAATVLSISFSMPSFAIDGDDEIIGTVKTCTSATFETPNGPSTLTVGANTFVFGEMDLTGDALVYGCDGQLARAACGTADGGAAYVQVRLDPDNRLRIDC